MIAIDDLQWLDASSASALGFALRRLPDADDPADLDPTARRGRAVVRRRGRARAGPDRPCSRRAAQRRRDPPAAPRRGSPARCARPTLLRLHEASGGNPFYALELARALGAEGAVRDPTLPLPVPERLEELVSARLAGLHRRDARSARARVRACAADGARAREPRHRAERARPGARGERDRARAWHRSLHASTARLGSLPGALGRRAAACARPAGGVRRRPGRARSAPRPLDGPAGRRARDRARAGGNGRRRPGRADRRGRARRARASAHSRPEPGGRGSPDDRGSPGPSRRGRRRAGTGAGERSRRAGAGGRRASRGARR